MLWLTHNTRWEKGSEPYATSVIQILLLSQLLLGEGMLGFSCSFACIMLIVPMFHFCSGLHSSSQGFVELCECLLMLIASTVLSSITALNFSSALEIFISLWKHLYPTFPFGSIWNNLTQIYFSVLHFPQVKSLGCDGTQPSVPAWLDSLGLQDYIQSFLSSGYSSIDSVKNLWELELVNVSIQHNSS